MQARPHARPAEQHHAEKARLQEERGQHLVGQQGPRDAAGKLGEGAPVGAELVGHHQARHHAHAEVDGEHLAPEMVQIAIHRIARAQPASFEHGEIARQADGDGRKDDVKGNRESELNPGQE